MKAALNLAADLDKRITTRRPWEIGLATLPGAEQSRNVMLLDDVVRKLIGAAYELASNSACWLKSPRWAGEQVARVRRGPGCQCPVTDEAQR